MAQRELAEHGVYRLEPMGVTALLSNEFGCAVRGVRRARRGLHDDTRKSGVTVSYRVEDLRPQVEPRIPLALFTPRAEDMTAREVLMEAARLAGKHFPGVLTIVPAEIQER